MKNEEKTPSDTNKGGKVFVRGNIVWKKYFSGRSEALNTLHVKLDCRKGNGGRTIFGMFASNDRVTEHEAQGRW